MPFTLTIDHTHRLARFVGTDPIKSPEVIDALRQQVAVGAWRYPALVDLTATRTWIPSEPVIEGALATARTLSQRVGPRGPVAFVVSGQDALYGMLRMHSALAETIGLSSDVFTSTARALEWLRPRYPTTLVES